MCYSKFHRNCFHLSFFFSQQFWSFKKPIARMQVASTLRNNNGERESISLLQILRKMVRINYCGNFTTFSITLVSPIEISLLKQSLIWRRFLSLHSLSSLIIRLLKNSHTSEPDKTFNFVPFMLLFDNFFGLILGGFKGSMVVACVYKDLHDLLPTDQVIRSKTDHQRYRYFRLTPCRLPPKRHNTETRKI